MIIDTDISIKEKLKEQSILFRQIMQELNGKIMDYETCRMLEDFLEEYSKIIFIQIEKAIMKIKEDYELVKKDKVTKTESK